MSDSMVIKSLFRTYSVHFIGDFTHSLKSFADKRAFFIVDALLWEIYGEKFNHIIPNERLLIVEASENNKSLDKCQMIIETLVDRKMRRNEQLVALGGGIIQDITAFSASIIYRGIEWSFFPSTLLAQADSCIGSKTSINLAGKKNLIGNFYPPSDVFIDPMFLNSLTVDDIKSGIGEILHYYLYAASPVFDELIRDYAMIIRDRALLMKYILESLKIKKTVIEIDEFDRGERNKFNYGHTFGHAIESITDYTIKHGQAVTVGMDLANYMSMKLGLIGPEVFQLIHKKLSLNFPEFDWNRINIDQYLDFLANDKKNIGDNIGCILANGPGMLIKQQVPLDNHFKEMICAYFTSELQNKEELSRNHY
jgi:3-dehydroquinate synthase